MHRHAYIIHVCSTTHIGGRVRSHWKITDLKLHRYTTVTVISYESQKVSHTNYSEVTRSEQRARKLQYYVKSLLVASSTEDSESSHD